MQGRQVHALRACSLLAIPAPEGRMPPPGGFPKDLASINLTGWAGLIQNVAQGMKMIPSNLSTDMYLNSMMLLQLLEATTGMGYCRICCQPTPSCLCVGAYESTPTKAWSRMMANISVPGVAASSAGSTMSEASTVEVQEPGVTSPTPGLTPQVGAYNFQGLHRLGDCSHLPAEGSADKLKADGTQPHGPRPYNPRCHMLPGECFRFINKGHADQLPPISCQRRQPVTQWLLISYQLCQRAYLWLPISYRCRQRANLWLLTSCQCRQ